jgi:probable rRNA maturation factor
MKEARIESLTVHVSPDTPYTDELQFADVRRAVGAAFTYAGERRTGELTVFVTDDIKIRELNRSYRGIDQVTDVLAFGNLEDTEASFPSPHKTLYFGDIAISYPRVLEQAADYGHSARDELLILVVHGALHLLGYDHECTGAREVMWQAQSAVLEALNIRWPE